MFEYLKAWFIVKNGEKGQDLAEYAILIGLIALVVIAVVVALGTQIQGVFQAIIDGFTASGLPGN